MHITLVRTGGIIPMTKKAETDVVWSEDEVRNLLKEIGTEEAPGQRRDGTSYQLETSAGTWTVDLDKIPAKYKKTFDLLKDNLAVAKPGKL